MAGAYGLGSTASRLEPPALELPRQRSGGQTMPSSQRASSVIRSGVHGGS